MKITVIILPKRLVNIETNGNMQKGFIGEKENYKKLSDTFNFSL